MILFEISREAFLPFLVFSFFAGVFFGAVYDVFRVRRKAFSAAGRKTLDFVFTLLEDIAFCLFCTVVLILICYKLYFGIPRWYSYAAAIGGFCLWRATVGRVIMALSDRIISAVIRLFSFVKRRLIGPMIAFFKRILGKIGTKTAQKRAVQYTKKRENMILAAVKK